MSEQPVPSHRSVLWPRAAVADGRLVVRYAVAIIVLWIGLAAAGVVFGFVAVSGDNTEGGYLGFGLGAICAFVAWFAARPVVVADRTGIAVLPVFGTRTALRWDEVRAIEVRSAKAARGRGQALMLDASDDRELKVDGLWVGLTDANLRRIAAAIQAFAATLDRPVPAFGATVEPDPW